jgi:nitrogenase molybdenum-cofactor synthesis protein NifE
MIADCQKHKYEFSPRSHPLELNCDRSGRPGNLIDRRCVIGAVREILGPILCVVHLIHGPLGCAQSSFTGAEIDVDLIEKPHFKQFSTDLQEKDIIFGGEAKLERILNELIISRAPEAVFVYATCVSSLIGDNIESVCKKAEKIYSVPIVFIDCKGYKSVNHTRLAGPFEALFKLVGSKEPSDTSKLRINLLGEYGANRLIESYFERIGIEQVVSITGSASIDQIQTAHTASLNLVQRSRPMAHLARRMNEVYGIPRLDVSFLGIESAAKALVQTAQFFDNPVILQKANELIESEKAALEPEIGYYRKRFEGTKIALNSEGPYKTKALIEALGSIGITVDVLSLRAVQDDERDEIESVVPKQCEILIDATPQELCLLARKRRTDLVIGGIEDGLTCRKHGIPFCLHNQQTLSKREGFSGMLRFASDIESAIFSPVWDLARSPFSDSEELCKAM